MHIPLVYEHLFYKSFVRRSVGQATKGKRASLLMDVVILVFIFLGSTSKPTPVIGSADVAGSRSTSKIGARSNSTLATPLTGQRGVLQRQGKDILQSRVGNP